MTKIEPTPKEFWTSEQMTEAIFRFLGQSYPLPTPTPEPDEAKPETEAD